MKILTFNYHEPFSCIFAKTGHQFYVASPPGARPWNYAVRPLPANCQEIPFELAKEYAFNNKYDLLLLLSYHGIPITRDWPLPRAYFAMNGVCTEAPPGEPQEKLRSMLRDERNLINVFLSEKKRESWKIKGPVVVSGIDPDDFFGYTGELPRVLRLGNLIKERDYMQGFSLQEKILGNDIPSTVIGNNPFIPGSISPKNWDEYRAELRRHRAILCTLMDQYEDGYNLCVLEAMSTGAPIVSIPNSSSPIIDGYNGFVSEDIGVIREKLKLLLRDPLLAKQLGENARKTIIDNFLISKFVNHWNQIFKDIVSQKHQKKRFLISNMTKRRLSVPSEDLFPFTRDELSQYLKVDALSQLKILRIRFERREKGVYLCDLVLNNTLLNKPFMFLYAEVHTGHSVEVDFAPFNEVFPTQEAHDYLVSHITRSIQNITSDPKNADFPGAILDAHDIPIQLRAGEERITPGDTMAGCYVHHAKRYQIIQEYCRGKKVLEVGCGTGYGSKMLSKVAKNIEATDVDSQALEFAKWIFSAPNIIHSRMDCRNLDFPPDSFDVVVSCQMVEHFKEVDDFFISIIKVMKSDGTFIIDTPNKVIYQHYPDEFHVNLMDLDKFALLCKRYFNSVLVLGQAPFKNLPDPFLECETESRANDKSEMFIAICRDPKPALKVKQNNLIFTPYSKITAHLKLLLGTVSIPGSTAYYYERAFRQIADVRTWGPHITCEKVQEWEAWNAQQAFKDPDSGREGFELVKKSIYPFDISSRQEAVSVREIFDKFPPGWKPDMFLWIDNGPDFLPQDLHLLSIPKVAILIDIHINPKQLQWKLEYAKQFDIVFLVHKNYMSYFTQAGVTNAFWLPVAADIEMHGFCTPKEVYDIGFVGQTSKQWHPRRVMLLEKLKDNNFDVVVETKYLEDIALFLSRCKIAFNCSLNGDLNMRVFEATAAGSMLLTDALPLESGLLECFEPGKHLALYHDEEELIRLADYYLKHPEERHRIAKAGREHTLANHTYLHRAVQLINQVFGAGTVTMPYTEVSTIPAHAAATTQIKPNGKPAGNDKQVVTNNDLEAIYCKVAHAFEGERGVLLQRRQRWVDIFKGCKHVLDIGCGEGMFLDLLAEAGINASGIDCDQVVVEKAIKKGHKVELVTTDELVSLGTFHKYDGIFLGHIIEHLEGKEALKLLHDCSWLLEPEGKLVVVTPNIHHPVVLSNFWMDITHKRPYPLNLLQEMISSVGCEIVASGLLEENCECYAVGKKNKAVSNQIKVPLEDLTQFSPLPCFFWKGAFFDPSGYGDEARNFAAALRNQGATIKVSGITKPSVSFLESFPEELLSQMETMTQTDLTEKYVHLTHFPAYAFSKDPDAALNVGRVMFESDSLPADWILNCNEMDEVWVPSRFNLETFTNAGVLPEKLVVIPGGVDAKHFSPEGSTLPLPGDKSFRFLSIFEWLYRKGWDILIEAYVAEFGQDEPVSLIIRTFPYGDADGLNQDAIENKVYNFIKDKLGKVRNEIPPIHFIKEFIPLEDMPALYRSCNAYVMPSRGEGWGKPYIEAMACGKPVIATAWGGQMEYLHAGNSFLIEVEDFETINEKCELNLYHGQRWAKPSISSLRKLMRYVFLHQDEAKGVGEAARKDVETNWTWEIAAKIIINHLQKSLSSKNSKQIGVVWEGSFLVNHSLANANREIVLGLAKFDNIALGLIPYEKDELSENDDPRFKIIKGLTGGKLDKTNFHVRHYWPPNWNQPHDGEYILIQPWEFGSLPIEWKNNLHKVREVWAYSNFVKDTYTRAGCPEHMVQVIPLGIDPDQYSPIGESLILPTKKKFRFLFVGGLIPRKGIDSLLNAYLSEFRHDEDVCLVIKDFYYKSSYIEEVERLSKQPDIPEIVYLHGSTSPDNLPKLFRSCQCYVHPYRGEGFGLPILEAMATALPVITTGYGPALEYCPPEYTYLIPSHVHSSGQKCIDTVDLVDEAYSAEPDIAFLMRAMRHVYNNYNKAKEEALVSCQMIQGNWIWENTVLRINERLQMLSRTPFHPWSFRPQIPVSYEIEQHNSRLSIMTAQFLLRLNLPFEAANFIDANPSNVQSSHTHKLLKAQALVAIDKKDEACEILKQVKEFYPAFTVTDWKYYLHLSGMLKEGHIVNDIIKNLVNHIKSEWDWLEIANILSFTGYKDEAILIYEECLKEHRCEAEAAYRIGKMAWKEGELSKAIQFLERAAEAFPGHALAWEILARAASQNGNSLIAEAAYLQAKALNPFVEAFLWQLNNS